MFRRILSFLACIGLVGCQPAKKSEPLPIKQLIESYKDAPLGKSINAISNGLSQCDVFIPTGGIHKEGQKLKLMTAQDNRGKEWAYIYTDESELLAAFPKGSPFVKMKFADLFGIIEKDTKFGGIFINHTDKYNCLIPREVFDTVRNVLDSNPKR